MKGGVVMVEGAALGAAFDLLLTSVVDASKKVAGFICQINRVESTLCSIKPTIDDIEKLNIILDRPPRETEAFVVQLTEAEQLVRRCSKVRRWNILMRFYYSNKLSKLEASLFNFFQFNVAALELLETKRISVVVSDLQEKLNQIATMLNGMRINHEKLMLVEESDEISLTVMDE